MAHNPDYLSFHKSVTAELYAIENRIRNLVLHWPTDGESKEAALRNVLRRHLPASVVVGRGFIVTNERSSTQIDILVIDAKKPTLFNDGDLLIVTPDAVLAVIEVKTKLNTPKQLLKALNNLSHIEKICHDETSKNCIWTGLFIFNEGRNPITNILDQLKISHQSTGRPIHCVSAGSKAFFRYWQDGQIFHHEIPGPVWHGYMLDDVAPSYFLGNLIEWIGSTDNYEAGYAWFPMIGGKEQHRKRIKYLLADNEPEN